MYSWVEHTAELELHIEAPSQEAIFAEAVAAFGELVGDEAAGEPVQHVVSVASRSEDRATLLADWLEELVFLAETQDFVPETVTELDIAPRAVLATVRGRRGRPSHLVKAVTYHGLELRPGDSGWRARLVLDV